MSPRQSDSAAKLPTPVSAAVDGGSQNPLLRRRRSSQLPPSPLAVLEVINKRGKGIFSKHDEGALVRLCTCVESLLRRKAAEVSLLWSRMAERSLIRKGTGPGGAGGGATNYARVESTIMRLYSKASYPTESVAVGEKRTITYSASLHGDGGGDGGGGGDHHRELSAGDSTYANAGVGRSNSSNGGSIGSVRRRGGSDSAVSGKAAVVQGIGGDGNVGIDRIFMGEAAQEESELVDLSMNLFELSSDQLLSLVGRFFRNMRLTELFQVCAHVEAVWSCLVWVSSFRGCADALLHPLSVRASPVRPPHRLCSSLAAS